MNPLRWQWLVLGVVLLYVGVGFCPLTAVEGDDIGISAGALELAIQGDLEHGFDYRYDAQPATYLLLAGLNRFFGISTLTGFGILTLAGFGAFFGFGAWLIARETGLSAALAGLVLLLWQECYVSAYYPNSSMIAAGFLFASLVLAYREATVSLLGSGVLFSLAIWSRFDALLMAPVFLLILWRGETSSWRPAAVFFVGLATALLAFAWAGGVSVGRIWQEGSGHLGRFASLRQTLVNYLTLTSGVGCLLGLLGLGAALKERDRRVLWMSLAGVVPLMGAYGMAVTTPKYLLYAVPFFALLAARGLKWLLASSSRLANGLRWACVVLLALQYVVGPLTVASWASGRNVVVVGTHDGLRRLDAIGYLPVMWLRTKLRYRSTLEQAEQVLLAACQTEDRGLVLTDDWFSSKWTAYQLLRAGYRCVQSARHFDHMPILTERDFHVYAKGPKRMTAFQVHWLREGAAARDWRSRVAWESYDGAILLSGQRDSREQLADIEQLLGYPVSVEPWPGLSGLDRLWIFRVRPASADPASTIEPEKER